MSITVIIFEMFKYGPNTILILFSMYCNFPFRSEKKNLKM